jgi:pantoate--beta-alanine ligase
MRTVQRAEELADTLGPWRRAGQRLAFVPTMGNLHDGHLSLIRHARGAGDRVAVSIFVNPLQFGPHEDYAHYPRTLEDDQSMLQRAGVDLLFAPDSREMYPSGAGSCTRVEVPGLSDILCGASRPGHFVGVTTVVARLFNLVRPEVAVFGEKDFQQLVIIRRMVQDLGFPVAIEGVATVREPDGLALSSRNRYLTAGERRIAPVLHATLTRLAERVRRGERDYGALEDDARTGLAAAGMQPEYVSVRECATLALPAADTTGLVALAAALMGKTRLIDNVKVT